MTVYLYLGPGHLKVLRSLAPWTMEMKEIRLWHGQLTEAEVQDRLRRLTETGLVVVDDGGWRLTDTGISRAASGWKGWLLIAA